MILKIKYAFLDCLWVICYLNVGSNCWIRYTWHSATAPKIRSTKVSSSPSKVCQKNAHYDNNICHFVIFFCDFSDNMCPRILQFKSHIDFICVSNRSNTPQVLWQWKFLRVSKKHFLRFWLSRFVSVHVSSTKGTRVRGNIKILT